jgi:hypothetical protein
MKKKLIEVFKMISKGTINSSGAIAMAIILGVLVLAAFALIPMLLIWGLQLMGFGVETSFSSYLGSVLILTYLSYAKIGVNKSSSKED